MRRDAHLKSIYNCATGTGRLRTMLARQRVIHYPLVTTGG